MDRKGLISLIIICGTFVFLGFAISFAKSKGQAEYTIALSATLIFLVYLFTYTIVHTRKRMRLSKKLTRIFCEDMDVDGYISEIKAEKLRKNSSDIQVMLSFCLASGYAKIGEFEKAIETLDQFKKVMRGYSGRAKALYYNDLAFFHFENGNYEDAIKAFSSGEKHISKQLKIYEKTSSFLDTKAHIEYAKGNLEDSEKLLKSAINRPNSGPSLLVSSNLLLAKIYVETDRVKEAILLLEYCLSQKLYSIDYKKCKDFFEVLNTTVGD